MLVRPFEIEVSEAVLSDLQRRLESTRWPDEVSGSDWTYGTNLQYLKELVGYWRGAYDWRAQEALLNSFPQFKAEIDGLGIHFVHRRGTGPNPMPLLLPHGWPSSHFEMYKIIEPLADPARHGGDAADSFDVVVPSLPGYGFSDRPVEAGVNITRVAEWLMALMTEVLGYERFAIQGGDWGALLATRMAHVHPDTVLGIHLNFLPFGQALAAGDLSEEERAFQRQVEEYRSEESGYAAIHSTKPQTLAYGLSDSPVGLAGWIVEKFRSWGGCGGPVESSFTKDELLTNVMIYWVTETINSSMRLHYEFVHNPSGVQPGEKVEVPTGVSVFPGEVLNPPRSVVEAMYNIQRWTVMPSGGHFAALEEPEALVREIREFFRPLRG